MAKNHYERFTEQRKYYIKLLDIRKPKDLSGQVYSDMPKGCRNDATLDEIVNIIQELDNHIFLQEESIKFYEKVKKESEEHLNKLTGLDAEVYRMFVLEGMSLQEIAVKLNYEYSYIKKISHRVKG